MIKNILHISTPIVLGVIFYMKNIADSTLAGLIAFFSFLAFLVWGVLYDKGYFKETQIELEIRYSNKLAKEAGVNLETKEDFFPYKYDAAKCSYILLLYILGWLVFVFFIEKKSSQNTNNNNNNTTVVDSSYTIQEEVSTTSYQENYTDISSSNQSDTTNYEYNSYSQINSDYEGNYFLGEWVDENSIITFKNDGKCTLQLKSDSDGNYSKDYFWKYENQILYMGSDINNLLEHSIYDKNRDSFSYKAEGENITYHAVRNYK